MWFVEEEVCCVDVMSGGNKKAKRSADSTLSLFGRAKTLKRLKQGLFSKLASNQKAAEKRGRKLWGLARKDAHVLGNHVLCLLRSRLFPCFFPCALLHSSFACHILSQTKKSKQLFDRR